LINTLPGKSLAWTQMTNSPTALEASNYQTSTQKLYQHPATKQAPDYSTRNHKASARRL